MILVRAQKRGDRLGLALSKNLVEANGGSIEVESEVSSTFREVTGGVYEEVGFDQANEVIWVRTADGTELEATQLSGGAYDQLYPSIRLALASKMLGGQKGFFILDDPFLTSDTQRLARQFRILRDLSEAGWQIIYFSVKDETRRALNDDIEAERVDLHELQSIHLQHAEGQPTRTVSCASCSGQRQRRRVER